MEPRQENSLFWFLLIPIHKSKIGLVVRKLFKFNIYNWFKGPGNPSSVPYRDYITIELTKQNEWACLNKASIVARELNTCN